MQQTNQVTNRQAYAFAAVFGTLAVGLAITKIPAVAARLNELSETFSPRTLEVLNGVKELKTPVGLGLIAVLGYKAFYKKPGLKLDNPDDVKTQIQLLEARVKDNETKHANNHAARLDRLETLPASLSGTAARAEDNEKAISRINTANGQRDQQLQDILARLATIDEQIRGLTARLGKMDGRQDAAWDRLGQLDARQKQTESGVKKLETHFEGEGAVPTRLALLNQGLVDLKERLNKVETTQGGTLLSSGQFRETIGSLQATVKQLQDDIRSGKLSVGNQGKAIEDLQLAVELIRFPERYLSQLNELAQKGDLPEGSPLKGKTVDARGAQVLGYSYLLAPGVLTSGTPLRVRKRHVRKYFNPKVGEAAQALSRARSLGQGKQLDLTNEQPEDED